MAALIPAGLSIVGGLLSKSSKNKEAAGIEAAGAASRAQLEPFVSAGADATGTISNALSGGPGAADAFKQFQNSTGFQSQLSSGIEGIVGNQATKGLLQSGSTLKRQTKFGQDLAQGGFQNFLSNLSGQAGRGVQAAGGAASSAQRTGVAAAQARGQGQEGLISGIGSAAQSIFGK